MTEHFDAVVVGAGAAGLSAAVALGRARRSVLVLDAGAPRNAPADGVHNFLTRDGTPPAELLAAGRAEAEHYGAVVHTDTAVRAERTTTGFIVHTEAGAAIDARALLDATGLVDELPDIPGLREHWGTGAIHCPYCHGWEARDRALGVLGSGPMTYHQTLLFRQWSADLALFQHTAPDPTPGQREQLAARGIRVVPGEVERIEQEGGRVTGVRLRDGTVVARDVLVVGPRIVAHSPVLDSLGVQRVPHPLGADVGEFYPADAMGASDVPGVWLAGNVTDVQAQVVSAAAQGLQAAAALNAALVEQDTANAVDQLRAERAR